MGRFALTLSSYFLLLFRLLIWLHCGALCDKCNNVIKNITENIAPKKGSGFLCKVLSNASDHYRNAFSGFISCYRMFGWNRQCTLAIA